MKTLVIGGGISGLTAAFRLHSQSLLSPNDSHSNGAEIQLWERAPRLGGVLQTVSCDGFQIELSADNFITTIPWGLELCNALGLAEEIVPTRAEYRRTYVVRRGKLHLLPDGFLMMAPTRFLPMATTPLLSPLGKLRAGLELFVRARRDDGDESLANFVRRRFGREIFERLVEPLVSGVYAADMEKLSVMATLPRFREMEREFGSLLWGMQRQRFGKKSFWKKNHAKNAAHNSNESGARYSMFVTLRSGLSAMIDALAAQLPREIVSLSREVTQLTYRENQWEVTDQNGVREIFGAVILATPAHQAAKLLHASFPKLSEILASIEYEGTAIVTLALDAEQIKLPLRGMGFVVPKIEGSPILAGSFSGLKYAHRAPEGKALIRLFAGGNRAPHLADLDDEKLFPLLWNELKPLLRINGEPHWSLISHWGNTMPQYHLGHRERISEMTQLVQAANEKSAKLALCGNYFHGVGIPQCIHSASMAAEIVSKK